LELVTPSLEEGRHVVQVAFGVGDLLLELGDGRALEERRQLGPTEARRAAPADDVALRGDEHEVGVLLRQCPRGAPAETPEWLSEVGPEKRVDGFACGTGPRAHRREERRR